MQFSKSDTQEYLRQKYLRLVGIGANVRPNSVLAQTDFLDRDRFPQRAVGSTQHPNLPSDFVGARSAESLHSALDENSSENLDTDTLTQRDDDEALTFDGEDEIESVESNSVNVRQDFRLNYLRKLSYANVWVPNARKPPSHQTITIFDWDDTLLCTTYINLRGDGGIKEKPLKNYFNSIQRYGKKLLELALKRGQVFIITNAKEGWVEHSAKTYLPDVASVLEKITIISARKEFEGTCPGDFHQWKVRAFVSVREQLDSQIVTNLISVGDSNIEMEAVHVMGSEFSEALIKTVKFREYPSPDELAKQLELVYRKFDSLCDTPKNLKIGLERKRLGNAQNAAQADGQNENQNENTEN